MTQMTTTTETKMTALEPWWISDDRKKLELMRNATKAKPDASIVRYLGDQRPQLCSDVREQAYALASRIEADIKRFNEVGRDYDKM